MSGVSLDFTNLSQYDISIELKEALDSLTVKRGTIEHWKEMTCAVLFRIANCLPTEHVWCKGEVHAPNHHYPAIVVFDKAHRSLKVLAPSGADFAMEEHDFHLFCSSIPHIAIAREVMSDSNNKTV